MTSSIFACVLYLASSVFSPVVFAHGDQPSLEKEVGQYLVDIGYDTVGIRPNEEVTFNFDLFINAESPSFAEFETVDVDITKGSETILSQSLPNQKNFVPMLKVKFPAEGTYQLRAQYAHSGAVIADASFELSADTHSGTAGRIENALTIIVATVLIIFSIGFIGYSLKKRFT